MPTSAWLSTTSYLSLVSPKTVEKLMGWTTNLNSPTTWCSLTYCEFWELSTRKQVVILSLDQLKSYFHCLPTTVFSETVVCSTPSPRYRLRLFSNDGPLEVGVNTSTSVTVWLVQSLGKSSIVVLLGSQHFANAFLVGLAELALCYTSSSSSTTILVSADSESSRRVLLLVQY